ncbi:MAG TPA: iron export ABC transporter permease subunit FetB [Bacillota bacterium]|nr:iron export ABC transporter permease subunit FetB [Bacillota bacterium]
MTLIIVFILFPLFISVYHQLKLEKDILLSSIRAFIQLSLLGLVLTFVFSLTNWFSIFSYILLMMAIAAITARKRGKQIPYSLGISFVSIFFSWAVTIPLWILFHIIRFETPYVLAVSGMVIGNAMTASSQTFHLLHREFDQTKDLIETKLALGFTMYQASHDWIKQTIKIVLIPNIDTLKTVGLVQMPGMMTGMILAGTPPYQAVKFQIVIMFSITAVAVLSVLLVSLLSYSFYFDKKIRIKRIEQ